LTTILVIIALAVLGVLSACCARLSARAARAALTPPLNVNLTGANTPAAKPRPADGEWHYAQGVATKAVFFAMSNAKRQKNDLPRPSGGGTEQVSKHPDGSEPIQIVCPLSRWVDARNDTNRSARQSRCSGVFVWRTRDQHGVRRVKPAGRGRRVDDGVLARRRARQMKSHRAHTKKVHTEVFTVGWISGEPHRGQCLDEGSMSD